jgi:D-xylose 1-dehydrogenase (NADP+, D-xylono-1,5-lactone-forming)
MTTPSEPKSGRLRWGILSTANIARNLFIPGVRAGTETTVLAVGSRELATAQQFAADLDIPRAYGSYADLLADPEVDAVYIGLPNSLHAEWTIRAAQAGKHVLCEKPTARRAADAQRMADACDAAGVVLMEAFMWRHHPQHARVRALLEAGTIGEPTVVRASFGYVIDRSRTGALNVRLARDLDGGSLMDVGCYSVNVARWVFGAEPVRIVGQQHVDADFGVETSFGGVLRFAGGQLALVDSSFQHAFTNRYEIAGPGGRIVVNGAFRPDDRPGRIEIHRGSDHAIEDVAPANQFALEADHFARSVRAGRLLPPAENGVAQARVIEALLASAAE